MPVARKVWQQVLVGMPGSRRARALDHREQFVA